MIFSFQLVLWLAWQILHCSPSPTHTICILVYVDDMVVTGSDEYTVKDIMGKLRNGFAVWELGRLEYFLGIRVRHTGNALYLDQQQYLVDLLLSNNLDNMCPLATPMEANFNLQCDEKLIECSTEYRRIVGSLQYLNLTHLDMTFSTNKLSQCMSDLKPKHWLALKRVLRYLSRAQTHGIRVSKLNSF